MIEELKTYKLTCDKCGYDQSFSLWKQEGWPVKWPEDWKRHYLTEEKGTRYEFSTQHLLCPECSAQVKNGNLPIYYSAWPNV